MTRAGQEMPNFPPRYRRPSGLAVPGRIVASPSRVLGDFGECDVLGIVALGSGQSNERLVLGGGHCGFAGEDPKKFAGRVADQRPLVIFFVESEDPIVAGKGAEEADFEFGIV